MSEAAAPAPQTTVVETEKFQQLVVTTLLAHEIQLGEQKQALDVELLLWDEKLKDEVHTAWTDPNATGDKRVTVIQLIADRFVTDGVPGGKRLRAETKEHLADSVVRFRAKPFKEPKEGKPWRFQLTPSLAQTDNFRSALSDLVASGGNDKVMVRRPQIRVGPAVSELAEKVLGKSKGKGKSKLTDSKGSGKGGPKGKGKGGKNKGDKSGKGKTNSVRSASPAVRVAPNSGPTKQTGQSTSLNRQERAAVEADRAAEQARADAAAGSAPPAASSDSASAETITPVFVPPTAPPPTYGSLVANDEAALLSAESASEATKRSGEVEETEEHDLLADGINSPPPPFKKSKSPEPVRTEADIDMSAAITA